MYIMQYIYISIEIHKKLFIKKAFISYLLL